MFSAPATTMHSPVSASFPVYSYKTTIQQNQVQQQQVQVKTFQVKQQLQEQQAAFLRRPSYDEYERRASEFFAPQLLLPQQQAPQQQNITYPSPHLLVPPQVLERRNSNTKLVIKQQQQPCTQSGPCHVKVVSQKDVEDVLPVYTQRIIIKQQ